MMETKGVPYLEDKSFELFIVGGTKTGDYRRERNEFRNQERLLKNDQTYLGPNPPSPG